MGKLSRDKGKRNERLAAKAVERVLGIAACRTAQNTGMNGLADLDMGDAFHPEVKVRKSIGACRYYEQALRDHKPGSTPFVLMREDRGDWMVMVALDHLPDLIRAINEQHEHRDQHNPARGAVDCPDHRDSCGSPDDR